MPPKPFDTKLTERQIKTLEKNLQKTLRENGLKRSDIKTLQGIQPFYRAWRQSKTKVAKAAQSTHRQLLQAIRNHQVSGAILKKRLKEVHGSLVLAAEKMGASETVASFEEEYLEFDGQARGATDAITREKIAIKVLALERRIEALIRVKQ